MVAYDENRPAPGATNPSMTSLSIFLISFTSIVAGALFGMWLRARLPAHRLGTETREFIRLGAGLLATLAAVVISLMIASAKASYDTQDAHFRQFAAHLVLADQLLEQYGPDAITIRILMRQAVPAAMERIRREKATASPQDSAFSPSSVAEQLYNAVEALSPVTDAQRALKVRIALASTDVARTRLLMFADSDNPILTPFLLILIFWLAVIFASFGLLVEPGMVVATALLVFALSVSSGLFLIADLNQPFAGFMQISNQELTHELAPLN
jgi:hypothetical protein